MRPQASPSQRVRGFSRLTSTLKRIWIAAARVQFEMIASASGHLTSVIRASHPDTLRLEVACKARSGWTPGVTCSEPARVATTSCPGAGFAGVRKRHPLNTATTGLPGLSCRENKKRDRLRGLIPIVVELVAQKNERQNARLAGGIDAHLALEAVDVEVPVSRR